MSKRLLIVGASARAAAMSAIRSGFEPSAVDRFGDLDLRMSAPCHRVDDYPAGLEQAMSAGPPGPWLYTGALENRPELIDRIASNRQLFGVSGESLRAVRDPFRLAAALAKSGLAAPRVAPSGSEVARDGSWLRKPLKSAGGCGVRQWNAESVEIDSTQPASEFYFQQRIDGFPVGAVYVAAAGRAQLLGVTRQLIGLDWCGLSACAGHRYRYCGSIGPLPLAPALKSRFEQVGHTLAGSFDLRGLFGVDAILANGEIWPVETNPRYTASVEILERVLGVRSIAMHVAACGGDCPPPPGVQPGSIAGVYCGKVILFAVRDTIIAPEFPAWAARQNEDCGWPTIADIPAGGTAVRTGQPLVTVLADGADEIAVLANLKSLATVASGEISFPGQKAGVILRSGRTFSRNRLQ